MPRFAFFLYCLLLTLGAALLAEFVLLPRMNAMPRAQLLAGFTAIPGSVIDGQTINALGFTGDTITLTKPPNTVRILVLGSSTMFNRHMAEKLKAALQKTTSQSVELLDAGIRSHTTRADVIKLKFLATYQWDYVLFYDGINDLWANHVLPKDFYADYRQLDPWYRRNALLDNSLLARYSYNTLYTWKWVVQQKLNAIFSANLFPHYQFVFPKKPYINAANFASLDAFTANVETIIDTSFQIGAKPILITFASHLPSNYSRQAFLKKALDYDNPDNYDSRDVYNWGPPNYVREGLRRENAALRSIAKQRKVMLIDIDSVMSQHGAWFGDVCHFNNAGVDIFVEQIAGALSLPR